MVVVVVYARIAHCPAGRARFEGPPLAALVRHERAVIDESAKR